MMHSMCNSIAIARIFILARSLRIDSKELFTASVCVLAGRYDNPIPTRFIAPIDCLNIPCTDANMAVTIEHQNKNWKTGSMTHYPASYSKRGKASIWPTEKR